MAEDVTPAPDPEPELPIVRTRGDRARQTSYRFRFGILYVVLAAIVLTAVVAVAGYLAVGSPGAPDHPYAQRLKAWRAADPASLRQPIPLAE